MTYLPELVLAVICGLILLTWCLCEWVKWWRARRDERTDAMFRVGLKKAFRYGWLDREKVK